MKLPRIKQQGESGGYYHTMSRIAGGKFIFETRDPAGAGSVEAEKFRELMVKLARFHGIEVLTWSLMSNHVHLLLREPEEKLKEISDEDLVERVRKLNGSDAAAELRWQLAHFREEMKHPELAEELKGRYLKRMGDVSNFMRELKGRFAQWYNRKHRRYGVLWAERFKSVLVEGDGEVLLTMAAYIDLNAVRAGLVGDPADYRYCGYGQAVGGNEKAAKLGLIRAMSPDRDAGDAAASDAKRMKQEWANFQAEYRKLIFGVSAGGLGKTKDGRVYRKDMDPAKAQEMFENAGGGDVGLPDLLRKRVRYFSAGLVIGGRAFVEAAFEANRGKFGPDRKDGARALRGGDPESPGKSGGWGKLFALRDLRKEAVPY